MSSTTMHDADLKWEFAPGWESQLAHLKRPGIEQWLQRGAGQVVKRGVNRTVYRVDLPQRTLFVKHYRAARWLGVWRHLVQASHSRREWRKALEVARRRVATAPPVAVVEQRRGWLVRDNYYISEAVAGAQTVDEFVLRELPRLASQEQLQRGRQLLAALAQLAASAHMAGIEHNDLHTGNILLRWPSQDAAPQLYLIDLPGVRFRRPLNWPRSRASLAMLGGGWFERLSTRDRHRFWREYLRQRQDIAASIPTDASQQVFERMRAHARRIASGRDKRSLRTNRDFQRIGGALAAAYGLRDIPADDLKRLALDPAGPLRRHRHEPVKIGHGSLLVQARLEMGDQSIEVAYKRSRPKTWWKRLLGMVRRSRAVSGWHTGHALASRGIATARPLAAIEPSWSGGESYLATQWISGALNLHLFGWELASCHPIERHRRACRAAESVGQLIGRMHAWHISHRDLKGCNLLFVEQADTTTAYLLDLDGVRFRRSLTTAQRARDLARVAASAHAHPWLSRTARLRFLLAYLRAAHLPREEWKPLWQAVARGTRPILARFIAQGKMPA